MIVLWCLIEKMSINLDLKKGVFINKIPFLRLELSLLTIIVSIITLV